MREVPPEHVGLVREWTQAQQELSKRAVFEDSELFFVPPQGTVPPFDQNEVTQPRARQLELASDSFKDLSIIGGLDISTFSEGSRAIVQLAVMSFPALELLDTVSVLVTIDEPYIPSFLAMREAKPLIALLNSYKQSHPDRFPQVLLVDGNGRLHERQAGLAVSIGVEANIPCIGIAKEYYPISTIAHFGEQSAFRSSQKDFKHVARDLLHKQGDYLLLPDATGQEVIGAAVYTAAKKDASRAVYVSSGHRISLHTAMQLACVCVDDGRLPVPIKIADNLSRAAVKEQQKDEAAAT